MLPLKLIPNTPLLAVSEASLQYFEEGWGQCLAEMIACQKTNPDENITVYGIVSTGMVWQFGQIEREAGVPEKDAEPTPDIKVFQAKVSRSETFA